MRMAARCRFQIPHLIGHHRCFPTGRSGLMPVRRWHSRAYAVVGSVLVVSILPGCAGRASITMVSLNIQSISIDGPLVLESAPQSCYYWENEAGEFCVAMRDFRGSILGKYFESDLNLSLVLPAPPPGSSKSYRVGRRSVRLTWRQGLNQVRGASLSGLVTIWNYEKGRPLRGRLRITTNQQTFFALTGWRKDTRVLVVGDFTAAFSPSRGEAILARTEEGAMARTPIAVPLRRVVVPSPNPAGSVKKKDHNNPATG